MKAGIKFIHAGRPVGISVSSAFREVSGTAYSQSAQGAESNGQDTMACFNLEAEVQAETAQRMLSPYELLVGSQMNGWRGNRHQARHRLENFSSPLKVETILNLHLPWCKSRVTTIVVNCLLATCTIYGLPYLNFLRSICYYLFRRRKQPSTMARKLPSG